jgi:uncharacterized protein YdeI (YjbR/CyaY-like superfamily)
VSPAPTPRDVQYFASTEELREWFDANHATADELWLGYHRKATGRPTVTWSEAVDEALCVGWIDSVRYRIDDERSAQRFTPRRPRSIWSAINVAKVAALTAEGRMRPAGLAAFEARDPARTAIYGYERDTAAFSPEEEATFRSNATAWADWERRPPGYRKQATHWVTSAKRPDTRAKRLTTLIDGHAVGEKPAPLVSPGSKRAP